MRPDVRDCGLILCINELSPWGQLSRGIAAAFLLAAILFVDPAAADRLDQIKARDHLRCGLAEQSMGLAWQGADGSWSGFDIEICQALAAAVFGDARKVAFSALSDETAFVALGDEAVDVVIRLPAGWSGRAEASTGRFVVPLLVGGQGFMVKRGNYKGALTSLSGSRVCVVDSNGEKGLERLATRRDWTFDIKLSDNLEDAMAGFLRNDCAAVSASRFVLAQQRAERGLSAKDYEILPDLVGPDPAGPFVASETDGWQDVVRWSIFALIEAEEREINSENVLEVREATNDPAVQGFLGPSGDIGKSLGLAPDWVVQIIAQVGNYGEIYARTLGEGSSLRLERGPNAVWANGGLLQAMPFQ